jgi:hypothetical protein
MRVAGVGRGLTKHTCDVAGDIGRGKQALEALQDKYHHGRIAVRWGHHFATAGRRWR